MNILHIVRRKVTFKNRNEHVHCTYSLFLKTNLNLSFRYAHFNFMSMQIKHDIPVSGGKNIKSYNLFPLSFTHFPNERSQPTSENSEYEKKRTLYGWVSRSLVSFELWVRVLVDQAIFSPVLSTLRYAGGNVMSSLSLENNGRTLLLLSVSFGRACNIRLLRF